MTTHHPPTAQDMGLTGCLHCGLVVTQSEGPCPRCHSPLHQRKPDSLSRSWALLLSAAILYIPANMLPIMETGSLFGMQKDTILSGILFFWRSGSQGLAVLIFTVSVLVPLLKMCSLAYLAAGAGRGQSQGAHQRTKLFRIIEAVGRWSMLDVFVVALMVGLVRFQNLAVIEAGPGAALFGAVVVLTMLASHSFDPRLIWDNVKDDYD